MSTADTLSDDEFDRLIAELEIETRAMGPNVPVADRADTVALDALANRMHTAPVKTPTAAILDDLATLPVKRQDVDELATLPLSGKPSPLTTPKIRQWRQDHEARREADRAKEKRLFPTKIERERVSVYHGRVHGGIKVHGKLYRWQRERDAPGVPWRADSAEAIVGMSHVAFSAAITTRSFDEILAGAAIRNTVATTLSFGRRPAAFVTYQGKRYSGPEFATLTGIPYRTVHRHMRAGVSGEEMIKRREQKKHAL